MVQCQTSNINSLKTRFKYIYRSKNGYLVKLSFKANFFNTFLLYMKSISYLKGPFNIEFFFNLIIKLVLNVFNDFSKVVLNFKEVVKVASKKHELLSDCYNSYY